jgi:hypothetical protein
VNATSARVTDLFVEIYIFHVRNQADAQVVIALPYRS